MPTKRLSTAKRRQRIIDRDGGRCTNPQCLDPTSGPYEVDHIIGIFYHDLDPERWPIERLEADDNLRTLCQTCHKIHSRNQTALRAHIKRLAYAYHAGVSRNLAEAGSSDSEKRDRHKNQSRNRHRFNWSRARRRTSTVKE